MNSGRLSMLLALSVSMTTAAGVRAAEQASHPFADRIFDSLSIERIECADSLLGSMAQNVAVDCGRVGHDFKTFRKEWREFAATSVAAQAGWHAQPRWVKTRERNRELYMMPNSRPFTPFKLIFSATTHQLGIAWIDEYPPCAETGEVRIAELQPTIRVDPEYPEDARVSRSSGAVLITVLIDETGRPQDVCVLSASPPNRGFEEAAVAAAEQWAFKPIERNGRPVPATTTTLFTFRLSGAYASLPDLVSKFFEASVPQPR